jgi:gluconokinase
MMSNEPRIVIVMGVMGVGKTTIGRLLAEDMGCAFHDGDDLHPPPNREKLSAGIPLTSDDRRGWIAEIVRLIRSLHAGGKCAVIACSALTAAIRDELRAASPNVVIVHLRGSKELIRSRLQERKGHFANAALLDSQFDALEESGDAVSVDVSGTPTDIVDAVKSKLANR